MRPANCVVSVPNVLGSSVARMPWRTRGAFVHGVGSERTVCPEGTRSETFQFSVDLCEPFSMQALTMRNITPFRDAWYRYLL
ncbi:hypothetical protein VZT92_016300 [Zoarces viviparus]|uniref:Uncharacterized protein n=1 Tax=Zoarces viviparus TaxID=48416 RepID=A0AAW1ETG2_ZOAVI